MKIMTHIFIWVIKKCFIFVNMDMLEKKNPEAWKHANSKILPVTITTMRDNKKKEVVLKMDEL